MATDELPHSPTGQSTNNDLIDSYTTVEDTNRFIPDHAINTEVQRRTSVTKYPADPQSNADDTSTRAFVKGHADHTEDISRSDSHNSVYVKQTNSDNSSRQTDENSGDCCDEESDGSEKRSSPERNVTSDDTTQGDRGSNEESTSSSAVSSDASESTDDDDENLEDSLSEDNDNVSFKCVSDNESEETESEHENEQDKDNCEDIISLHDSSDDSQDVELENESQENDYTGGTTSDNENSSNACVKNDVEEDLCSDNLSLSDGSCVSDAALIPSRSSTAQKEKKSVSFNDTVGFISVDDDEINNCPEDSIEDLINQENEAGNENVDRVLEEINCPSPSESQDFSREENLSQDLIEILENSSPKTAEQVGDSDNLSQLRGSSASLEIFDDDQTEYDDDDDWEDTSQDSETSTKFLDDWISQEHPSGRKRNLYTGDSESEYSFSTFETDSATSLLDRIDNQGTSPSEETKNISEKHYLDTTPDMYEQVDKTETRDVSYSDQIKNGCQSVNSLQKVLTDIFHNSTTLLHDYKNQLNSQQLKDFALNLADFRENFLALAELFTSCEKLSLSMNKELKELRYVTDDVCNLINRKFRDEDLDTWVDEKPDEYAEKERIEEERIASNKAVLAKAADARSSTARAATVAAETEQLVAESEAEAAEAELAAKKAREVAEDALKAVEDAARAAEERKKAEDEARRRAEEKAKVKAEEERKRKEEEDKRLEAEAKKKGTSVDIERSREEEERARKEAERKNPNNWPRYIYSIEPGDFDPGLGCIIRAIDGSLNRDDLEVQLVDQLSGVFKLNENEELISNVIEVKQTDAEKSFTFEEPFSLVIPHCAPRGSTGREPVVKWYNRTKEQWTELATNDIIIEDIKDARFVEARGKEFGMFAVVYRLKRENFTFSKKGGKISSSVDTRFTMTTKPGAFRYNIGITTEIQPVDSNTVAELRQKSPEECGSLLASTPIIKIMWKQSKKLPKPVNISLPCPPNPSRVKRPATAITREKMDRTEMRPQTARSMAGYIKKEEESKHEDDLHLLCRDEETGNWSRVQNVVVVQAKNKDLVSFDMIEPMDRFVVLRTKLELVDYQVEKIATRLEKALLNRNIQLFLRQRGDDLNDILVSSCLTNKADKVLQRLVEEGYDEGPPTSKDISVVEGQAMEIRFRGNLGPEDEHMRTVFPFNTHIPCRIRFNVNEIDKFAQRGFNSYRGFVQVYTEGLVPKIIPESEERDTGKSRNAPKNQQPKIEMVKGEVLITELLMTIPKPDPEPPQPLKTAPLSIKPEGPVNEDVFRFISRELGDEWKKLAQYLNVRRMRIQAILRQNVNSERQQTIYDMLVCWAKRIPRAMDKVEMLCHALNVCGRGDLVEVLRERNATFKREMAHSARDSYLRKAFVKVSRDQKVASDWKVLAKRLGLGDRTLQEIESSRPTRQDRCFSSLQKWRDANADEANIETLSQKLKECRYRGLAREISSTC